MEGVDRMMVDSKSRDDADVAGEEASPRPRRLFRYRTSAFHGKWFESEEEAVEDAIRAGQAMRREGRIVLRSDCRIETKLGEGGSSPDG
jgi:hypothetical protein